MSGRWRVQARGRAIFGRPWLVLRGARWEAIEWNGPVLAIDTGGRRRVGLDIIGAGIAPGELARALRSADPRRLLGEVLLDQRVISGVGNMWAAEALWQARLSPWLQLDGAADAELEGMIGWLRPAMQRSVSGVGTARSVCGRSGRPCPRCGGRVSSCGLGDANRTAYWCPGCQRGPSPGVG